MNFDNAKIQKAFQWLKKSNGENFLPHDEYCPTRDIFQARLDRMTRELQKVAALTDIYSLITAIAGEFGNNSFDHNLGSWRDVPGIYFIYDIENRFFVIADRGQGVLSTLRHIRPELPAAKDALKIAFTEAVSGRAPEQRGNGLKFVDSVVKQNSFELHFYSGDALYAVKTIRLILIFLKKTSLV